MKLYYICLNSKGTSSQEAGATHYSSSCTYSSCPCHLFIFTNVHAIPILNGIELYFFSSPSHRLAKRPIHMPHYRTPTVIHIQNKQTNKQAATIRGACSLRTLIVSILQMEKQRLCRLTVTLGTYQAGTGSLIWKHPQIRKASNLLHQHFCWDFQIQAA